MFIPGILISLVTFPGVILHEWSHKKACNMLGITVHKVCYFRLGNPTGYVMHERSPRLRDNALITLSPFLINTAIAFLLFSASRILFGTGLLLGIIFWIALSAGMHAFPSRADAKNLWNESKTAAKKNKIALLAFPVAVVFYIADILRIVWFDLVYAALIYYAAYHII